MQHRRSRSRLNVKPAHANLMERNLLTSILLYEEIRTTRKRAKVIQPIIDRVITIAKKNPPRIAIRSINRFVTDKNASKKIMEVFVKRYANRPSGFSRIKIAGSRKGDGAEMVDLTLVDAVVGKRAEVAKKKAATSSKNTTPKVSTAKKTPAAKTSAKKESSTSSKKKTS